MRIHDNGVDRDMTPEELAAYEAFSEQEAKRAKDFARADDIRKQIEAAGFELRDTPQGTEWKRLAPGS